MRSRWKPGAILASALAIALSFSSCSKKSNSASLENGSPMVIEPNVAVGKIRVGMRAEDVLKLFGEPQRRTANAIEYTSLGFAVMPSPDGIVEVVMCGDVTGVNGPLVKAFTGRTKEGIGLGSTREEVLKAYGQPTVEEKLRGNNESLRYDPLGIKFTLENGKVYHMIVRLRTDQQQQQPGVTVDLSPSSSAK